MMVFNFTSFFKMSTNQNVAQASSATGTAAPPASKQVKQGRPKKTEVAPAKELKYPHFIESSQEAVGKAKAFALKQGISEDFLNEVDQMSQQELEDARLMYFIDNKNDHTGYIEFVQKQRWHEKHAADRFTPDELSIFVLHQEDCGTDWEKYKKFLPNKTPAQMIAQYKRLHRKFGKPLVEERTAPTQEELQQDAEDFGLN